MSTKLVNYYAEFVKEADNHVATLRHLLRSVEDGSYSSRVAKPNPNHILKFTVNKADTTAAVTKQEINKSFKALIGSFIDYLDKLIANIKVVDDGGILISRQLNGEEEILRYVEDYIKKYIQKVAEDRSLSQPQKVLMFSGLSDFSKEAANGYFIIRNCLEHHKGIPNKEFSLIYRAQKILIDGTSEVNVLPTILQNGQSIGIRFDDSKKVFKIGEPIEIREQELDDVLFTLKAVICPEILRIAESKLALQA